MVFKRADALRSITESLAWIANSCKLQGVLKLFDNHVLAQHFFCRVLNSAYGLDLKQMDQIQANYPAIDLGDTKNKIAYQITTERRSEKVQHTLDKFVEHNLHTTYNNLRIVIIGERQQSYRTVVVPSPLQFDCDGDIIGIQELCHFLDTLETDRLNELQAIFDDELKYRCCVHATNSVGRLACCDISFLEDGTERMKPEDHTAYPLYNEPEYRKGIDAWCASWFSKAGELPILDVKLRNTSSEIALVKRVVFRIRKTWHLRPSCYCYSKLEVSANYHVYFPRFNPPFEVACPLSQAIPPNNVDRFTLTLRPQQEACIILAGVELLYDEDNKQVFASDILFAMLGHDHSFSFLTEQELLDKPASEYRANNAARDAVQAINVPKSKAVRAFEEGNLSFRRNPKG